MTSKTGRTLLALIVLVFFCVVFDMAVVIALLVVSLYWASGAMALRLGYILLARKMSSRLLWPLYYSFGSVISSKQHAIFENSIGNSHHPTPSCLRLYKYKFQLQIIGENMRAVL